jgi:hypothetical protein
MENNVKHLAYNFLQYPFPVQFVLRFLDITVTVELKKIASTLSTCESVSMQHSSLRLHCSRTEKIIN